MVRTRRREADFQQVANAAPCMQYRTPSPLAVRVDQRLERGDDARLRERFRHQSALPQMIFGERPVLHGAAAAMGKMLADRRRAFVARSVDTIEVPAVGMAGDGLDRHRLARQRVGHVDRPCGRVGDTVAAMAEAGNRELLGH